MFVRRADPSTSDGLIWPSVCGLVEGPLGYPALRMAPYVEDDRSS